MRVERSGTVERAHRLSVLRSPQSHFELDVMEIDTFAFRGGKWSENSSRSFQWLFRLDDTMAVWILVFGGCWQTICIFTVLPLGFLLRCCLFLIFLGLLLRLFILLVICCAESVLARIGYPYTPCGLVICSTIRGSSCNFIYIEAASIAEST